ncbi:MAG: hypothetical protein WBZ19_09665 [Chthoniobacterales bacterium]
MKLYRRSLVSDVPLASLTPFAGAGPVHARGVPNKPVRFSGNPFINPQPFPPRKTPGPTF